MWQQLVSLGFIPFPDDKILAPYRKLFIYYPFKGDPIEVTLKNGKIYHTQRKTEDFNEFIEAFKKKYEKEL